MSDTDLMDLLSSNDPEARQRAWDVVYPELLELARAQRRRWDGDWTLETRALAHEAYLKLFRAPMGDVRDSRHFLRLVSRAMRQVLINYAEAGRAAKRGGSAEKITLDDELAGGRSDGLPWDQMLELDQAIEQLREIDPRAADIVELRFFAGLTNAEISEALEVSLATVGRDWAAARAWLSRELRG